MIPRRLLYVSLAFVFVSSLILAQQPGPPAQTKRESGLSVTTFETRQGTIRVSLPDDMAAGDTLSGTVVAEPSGKNDEEKQKNAAELNGYVIDLENQKAKVSSGVLQRVHLAPGINEPRLILLDANGKPAGTIVILLQRPPATFPNVVILPTIGQASRPIQIRGPFDGDSTNMNVKIGDAPAKVLAESPRKLIVESPLQPTGPNKISVHENGTSAQGAFRNLKIDLTAPKTSLMKGESTELHVEVQGLQGITQPIPVQIQNQSPSTVNIAGGNTQTIPIQPSQVSSGGTFIWSTNVTGTGAGGFNITGSLPTGTTPPPTSSPATSKPTPTPTPMPTTTPLATTPPQTKPAATPIASPVTPPPTHAIALPTPTEEQEFYNSFADVDSDCCKKLISGGVLSFSDGKGNGFTIDHDKLRMTVDGQTTEWQFTQDGKPFWIEWMFCHLNDDQVVSQLSSVMAQQIVDGKVVASTNVNSVTMTGPFYKYATTRPHYLFQFMSQKTKNDAVAEYSVSFTWDAETCSWLFQVQANGTTHSFRTAPPRGPYAISIDVNGLTIPSTYSEPEVQQDWWNKMYLYFSEIEECYYWFSQDDQESKNTNQTYNVWRAKLQTVLGQMLKSASPDDKKLIGDMLDLLKNTNPSPDDMKAIRQKFDDLHLRYGTPVPPEQRHQIVGRP